MPSVLQELKLSRRRTTSNGPRDEIPILRTDKDKLQAPFVYVSPSRTLLELSLWFSGLHVCHIPVIDERNGGYVTVRNLIELVRNQLRTQEVNIGCIR
jgi:hypothetical protein